jgi:hypothetical protein
MAWLALVPFVAFALAFFIGLVFVLWFVKRVKITETQTKGGEAMLFESPVGTLDVRPEEKLDARLAGIPVYPGSLRETPLSADTVSELHYGHTTLLEVSLDSRLGDSCLGILPAGTSGLAAQLGRKHGQGADSPRAGWCATNSRDETKRERQDDH